MSVIPPGAQADLAQMLEALQSSDNNVRSQAEEHLTNNWQANKPEILLMGLVEQLQGAGDSTVRYSTIDIPGHFLTLTRIDAFLCGSSLSEDLLQVAQTSQR